MLLRSFLFFISLISLTQAYNLSEIDEIEFPPLSAYFHKGKDPKSWKIDKDFSPYYNKRRDVVQKLTVRSQKTDIFIKQLDIRLYKDGHHSIHITSRAPVEDKERALEKYNSTLFRSKWSCGKENDFARFLTIFYQKDLLPNFVIETIFKNIEMDDFRVNEKTFFKNINRKLPQDASVQDFKKALADELKKVKDPQRSQNLVALLICDLIHSNPDRSLILELCQQVQDPNVSLFNEVRKIESDLIFTDDSATWTTSQRQSRALHSLLRTYQDAEAKKMMALEFKSVFFGGKVTSEAIPRSLQDFIQDQNPDSMTNLLMFVGDQQRQIRKLQQQISRLNLDQK